MRYKFYQYPRGANKGGILKTEICPTISTSSWENNCFLIEIMEVQKDNLVIEPKVLRINTATKQGYDEVKEGSCFDGAYPDSLTRRGRVQEKGNVSPALCTSNEVCYFESAEPRFRIRKLTPRECFRLMGVNDTDIDKIQAAGISNSQQYKMAGNSIVVDVLFHIFRMAFIENQKENLTLF